MTTPLIIHVGSKSVHKVTPVKNVCLSNIHGPVKVISFPAKSGVSDQPFGIEETTDGAINRAVAVWSPGIIAIGIEGGLAQLPSKYLSSRNLELPMLCMAVIVAMDCNGKMYFSTSSGMQFPSDAVREAKKRNITVGMVLSERYGGDHTDPREILSFGRVHRCDAIEEAVKIVLLNIC